MGNLIKLTNGVGSILIGFYVAFILVIFTGLGSFGPVGFAILFMVWIVVALGTFNIFDNMGAG